MFLNIDFTSFWIELCDETIKHWNDFFFIRTNTISNVKNWKFEHFNELIVSKNIANSIICFCDVANATNVFNEIKKLIIADFFIVSHIKLNALIEKWKFLTNFKISWLRICSYNSLLKLKFCLQNLQIFRKFVISKSDEISIDSDITSNIFNWKFEFLETRRTNFSENVFAKILSKRFNEINSNWVLNHSDAKSHKHFDNKFSKFDLRYWCRHCWKFCKKFAITLYNLNSDLLHVVESKISIFWNVEIDLTVCFVFEIFLNSTDFSLETSNVIFNFRCFCEMNDSDKMKIDCIVTNSSKRNVFVKIISKSFNEMNFDWSSNHVLTMS